MTAEEKLKEIEDLVRGVGRIVPVTDDIYVLCGGDYVDAYYMGLGIGQSSLADQIDRLLQSRESNIK